MRVTDRIPDTPDDFMRRFGGPGIIFGIIAVLVILGFLPLEALANAAATAIRRAFLVVVVTALLAAVGVFGLIGALKRLA